MGHDHPKTPPSILSSPTSLDSAPIEVVLEQYKLAIAGADRTTLLRIGANRFYLSVVTLMSTGIGMFVHYGLDGSKDPANALLLVPIIVTCWLWYSTLDFHRKLNSAKFKAINELEQLLPTRPYGYEWDVVHPSVRLRSSTKVEQWMPLISIGIILLFGALYFLPNIL